MRGGEPTQKKETFSGLFLWRQRESGIAVGCNNRSSVVRKEPWESPAIGTKKRPFWVSFCGANGNRTSDTRIFSPLLYQLSYGTLRSANRTIGCRVATLSARLPPLSPLHVFCGNPIESPYSSKTLWGPRRHPTRAKLFGDPGVGGFPAKAGAKVRHFSEYCKFLYLSGAVCGAKIGILTRQAYK